MAVPVLKYYGKTYCYFSVLTIARSPKKKPWARFSNEHATKELKKFRSASASSPAAQRVEGLGTKIAFNYDPHKGWAAAGSCLTVEAYQHFDTWKNDYQPGHYYQTDSVRLIHLGNPCDRPNDLRARKWILAWDTPGHNPPENLVDSHRPVLRVVYKCSGHCQHGRPSSSEDSSGLEGSEEDGAWVDDDDEVGDKERDNSSTSDTSNSELDAKQDVEEDKALHELSTAELNKRLNKGSVKHGNSRPSKLQCPVILHAEVYSDELSKVYFFQRGSHPDALPEFCDISPYMARTLDLSAAGIKRRLLYLMEDKEHPIPTHRRPNATQVNNVVNNARRKERLLSDPLLSIGVFAQRNPDKIFQKSSYSPPNYLTDPPTEFATGIHHEYGTQAMLLGAWKHGVGHDSTYRHMNENRAPLTIMITLDEEGRMVPGFAYLSGDTTIETQATFLAEAKNLVEKMAADLIAGRVAVATGLKAHAEALMKQAQLVVEHGWRPKFFMIDKYRASKAAIRRRAMEAILRWERDHSNGDESHARPSLDNFRKHQLLWAVREIQRCRDPALWPQYLNRFRVRLDAITEGSRTNTETLWDYFEANWFCDEWREHWTDMGLPTGENRDGMLSTNNWTERAFKTFNQVFLGNRNNKSIFRLVLILANEWFQYYQAWKPRKQLDTKLFEINSRGHHLWCCEGAVQPFEMPDGRQAWRVVQGT
ncbi:hypothetical protein B0H11DRAFT_1902725 [Mycena galericulata]|nr:hypothetical protein B0H11DRAFT_1902725 [Mycena galericulata]